MTAIAQPSKSPVLRVATAASRALAMAAIWQSNWLMGIDAANWGDPGADHGLQTARAAAFRSGRPHGDKYLAVPQ